MSGPRDGGEFPVTQVDGAGQPMRETSGRRSKPTSPAGKRAGDALDNLDEVLGEFGDPGLTVRALTDRELAEEHGIEPLSPGPYGRRANVAPPAGSIASRMQFAERRDELGVESDGEPD